MVSENNFLTPEENLMLEQLQAKKIQSMQFQIESLRKENKQLFTELHTQGNDIKLLKNDLTSQYEKISYQQQKTTKDYLGLSQLGALHSPPIGSQYMGKLLRKVGVCQKFGNTQPRSEYLSGKDPLVINKVGESGYMSWYYHHDRTWRIIKRKLDDTGLRNEFESCKTKDELHSFIRNF